MSITIVHHLVVTWDMVGIDKSQTSELAQVNGPRSVQSLFVTLSASQPHSSTLPIQIQGAATMTQKEFFSDLVWLGKIIRFSHSTDTSGWRLETKYNDKNDQLTAEDYNIDAVNYRKPSAAYGTFRCRNVKNDGDIAVLKIIMQFVYRMRSLRNSV